MEMIAKIQKLEAIEIREEDQVRMKSWAYCGPSLIDNRNRWRGGRSWKCGKIKVPSCGPQIVEEREGVASTKLHINYDGLQYQ